MSNTLGTVNLAVTKMFNNTLKETNPPIYPWGGTFLTSGVPTTNGLSRGALANTGVYITNTDLSHICDFRFVLSTNFSLTGLIPNLAILSGAIQNGKMAAANAIRSAMAKLIGDFRIAAKAITFALNLDPSGEFSRQYSVAKSIVRDINEKLKQIAQVIADVAFVYYLIKDIEQIIAWIETLPAEVKALIQGCLKGFTSSLAAVKGQVAGTIQQVQGEMTSSLVSQLTVSQAAVGASTTGASPTLVTAISDPINSSATAVNGLFTDSVNSANVLLATTIINKKAAASGP